MNTQALTLDEKAREYIDAVIEINRHFGMDGDVSEEMYNKAVGIAVDSVRGLVQGAPYPLRSAISETD
jgi:uncharacterized OsmC-like protein